MYDLTKIRKSQKIETQTGKDGMSISDPKRYSKRNNWVVLCAVFFIIGCYLSIYDRSTYERTTMHDSCLLVAENKEADHLIPYQFRHPLPIGHTETMNPRPGSRVRPVTRASQIRVILDLANFD